MTGYRRIATVLATMAALACTGCAHSILIAPNTDRLPTAKTPARANISVAYLIAPADKALTVTTPGGGGDKVSYAPYKDLEAPLYHVLSNHFAHVYALPVVRDDAFIQDKQVQYVFTPRIETSSSSDSLFTWPPTDFSLAIDVTATDASSRPAWHARVSGSGHAVFSEFKNDFGLAAKRAAEEAFQHLDDELAKFPRD